MGTCVERVNEEHGDGSVAVSKAVKRHNEFQLLVHSGTSQGYNDDFSRCCDKPSEEQVCEGFFIWAYSLKTWQGVVVQSQEQVVVTS